MEGEIQKRVVLEDITIIGGLLLVQFVYAGNSVLLSYLMSLGLNPLTIVIFTALSTFLVLSPLSFCFERYLSLSLSISWDLWGMMVVFVCNVAGVNGRRN